MGTEDEIREFQRSRKYWDKEYAEIQSRNARPKKISKTEEIISFAFLGLLAVGIYFGCQHVKTEYAKQPSDFWGRPKVERQDDYREIPPPSPRVIRRRIAIEEEYE